MPAKRFTREELIPALGRFLVKVQRLEADDCWPWMAAKDKQGYGRFKVNGEHIYAHRMAFILAQTDDLGADQVVMHKCDNPTCCNPRHLTAGTVLDNIADRCAKGRTGIANIMALADARRGVPRHLWVK